MYNLNGAITILTLRHERVSYFQSGHNQTTYLKRAILISTKGSIKYFEIEYP